MKWHPNMIFSLLINLYRYVPASSFLFFLFSWLTLDGCSLTYFLLISFDFVGISREKTLFSFWSTTFWIFFPLSIFLCRPPLIFLFWLFAWPRTELFRILAEFLAAHDLLAMFYCYRWVLLHFKREFAMNEVRKECCLSQLRVDILFCLDYHDILCLLCIGETFKSTSTNDHEPEITLHSRSILLVSRSIRDSHSESRLVHYCLQFFYQRFSRLYNVILGRYQKQSSQLEIFSSQQ